MSEKTIAQRFVEAFGSYDMATLNQLYSDDVVLYSPLVWGQKGKQAFLDYADEFHKAYSPLRIVLHDKFYSPDGARGYFQFVFHWNSTGEFYGNPPTGESGVQVETHVITIRDGKIVEQWVGATPSRCPIWTS